MFYKICGRAKSGKTEYIMSKIGEMIKEKRHTFLIVPEQQAVIAEREIIKRFGNSSNMYVEVINFKRLCNRVFREVGGLSQSYIDKPRMLLVMARTVDGVRDLLTEYKAASENAEFAERALSAVNEFKQYCVTPEMLSNAADGLCDSGASRLSGKLSDLSVIYAAYEKAVEAKFDDSASDLDRLCDVIGRYDFFKGDAVFVDSFYGYTMQELRILYRILSSADDTYISFLLESGAKNELFARSEKAYEKLGEYAESFGIPSEEVTLCESHGYADGALEFLEKNFSIEAAAGTGEKYSLGDGERRIAVVRCPNRFDEADAVCALIKKLVSEKGVRYSEIALCARNAEAFEGIIDTALTKNGIPFNFNVRSDLMTRPAVAYILSAFDAVRTGWQQQSVLRHVKTGLTALTDEEADLFESYVKTWSITGRRFLEDEWEMNPDGYSEDFSKRGEYVLGVVNTALEKLMKPLINFADSVKSAENCNDISRAVFELLSLAYTDSDGNFRVSDEDDIVYRNLMIDALDCLAEVIGDEKISAAKYAELLNLVISGYDTGRIPASIDEVTVSSAEGLRAVGIKHIIVMGVNDGVFPATPSEDSIFSDRDKTALKEYGIELRSSASESVDDELFLAYKVLTSASESVYITCADASPSGEELGQSIIVKILTAMFPDLSFTYYPFDGKDRFMFSKQKLFDMAFSDRNPEARQALTEYFSSGAADGEFPYAKLLETYTHAESSAESLSGETAQALYGEKMTVSPSRLEAFGNCEFSYYGNYILRLRPERTAELGSLETGNIAHRILELLVPRLVGEKDRSGAVSEEFAVSCANELLSGYLTSLCGIKSASTKRFEYLYSRLSGTVCELAAKLADELSQSDFIPTEYELPIGLSSEGKKGITSARIPLPDGGTLLINGKIDRTDVYVKNGKAYVRIIDYKTGNKKFRLSDVALGVNLQMLLYLYSLDENAGKRFGGEVVPAGVLYTPVKRPEKSASMSESSPETSPERPNGILIDDEEVLRAMEKDLSGKYIPVKVKKDGSLYASSSVVTLSDMGRLLGNAADIAAKLAAEIKKGGVKKNPLKCKEKNSCSFCELLPLCRFDFANEKHIRYEMTRYTDDEVTTSAASGENKE